MTPPIESNTRVRLVNDPERTGITTSKFKETSRGLKYQVRFDDNGQHGYQPEYELEIIKDDSESWDDLLERKRFGKLSAMQRHLTHIHLNGRLANVVYSMETTNTKYYPHQYKPLLSFLESPSGGLLIADEVGLGKTIEAGLIWTELRARRDARRLLVICPAMLCDKWRDELQYRFGVETTKMGAQELLTELRRDKGVVPDGKGIVCSLEGIRPPSATKRRENPKSIKAKLVDLLESKADEDPLIDLCIIDEAHYLRNPESQSNKLGELIRNVSGSIILLSATPVNLHSDDLFHLLEIVDPDFFQDKRDFPEVLEANAPLIQARDLIRKSKASLQMVQELLDTAAQHRLLEDNRQLATLRHQLREADSELSMKDKVRIAGRIERVNMLGHVVNRTRKREMPGARVIRRPSVYHVPMGGHEEELYSLVTDEIRKYAALKDISDGFLLASPQRQVSSCMYAAVKGWIDKDTSVREQLYDDLGEKAENGDQTKTSEVGPLVQHMIDAVLPKVDLKDYWNVDSKFKELREHLENYFGDNPNEKVIIFSYFKGTINYLSKRLEESGFGNMVLYGGVADDKQEYIAEFRNSKTAKILIASEVASEGVDLQFCKMLVNYDLPWNPMKVEQRIGRLDRIGQESDSISILNLCHEGTIDHRIVERLHKRLGVFKTSIGELEPILGPVIYRLTNDLIRHDLTPQEIDERLEQTEQAIEQERKNNEELEKEAPNLLAHGDYILQKVKAARDFRQRISHKDLIAYVKYFLDNYAQGHTFREIDQAKSIYEMQLPADVAADYNVYVADKKSSGSTRLQSGQPVKCQFANKVHQLTRNLEQISQFHPLIRYISSMLDHQKGIFHPLIAAQIPCVEISGVQQGLYAFSLSRWTFKGLRTEEEIRARVKNLHTGELFPAEISLKLMNALRASGDNWTSSSNQDLPQNLEEAIWECIDSLESDYEDLSSIKIDENFDRVSFQIQSIESNRTRRAKSLKATIDKLGPDSRQAPAFKRQLENHHSRCDVQVETYEKKKDLVRSQDAICCGIIKVM
jgi:superfamily II DNA or RNA helicase